MNKARGYLSATHTFENACRLRMVPMNGMVNFLEVAQRFLWTYVGLTLIIISGIYFTYKSRFAQLVRVKQALGNFFSMIKGGDQFGERGASPFSVFFASLGGSIGIGNIVSIAVGVQIGGPGALIWVWLVAFLGMIIKYAEVYLGIRFRVENESGSYDGGPMYFLRYAFPNAPVLANIMAILMC